MTDLEIHIVIKPTPTEKFGALATSGDGRSSAYGIGRTREEAVAAALIHLAEIIVRGKPWTSN